jgi:hypothetical protein
MVEILDNFNLETKYQATRHGMLLNISFSLQTSTIQSGPVKP